MGYGENVPFAVVPTVFKREDYKHTKHDAVFSKWQILIGSKDWEGFKEGKEGVGRYRVQNLPTKSFPGLYELGVAVMSQEQGRKLEADDVLASYLGQAENVRSRLQSYGRSAAHLRNVNLIHYNETIESPDKKAVTSLGLFEDIFSKGGSILYRWAPMRSKREAEATEGMLLCTFDYAWNKGSNGERRQLDLLKKLCNGEFMNQRKPGISKVLFPFLKSQVGEKQVVKEERKLSCNVAEEESNFMTSILKFTKSKPQEVSDNKHDSGSVCGVILEDGSSCNETPVKGRKRCIEHKGQRICRVSPEKQRSRKAEILTESNVICGVILPESKPCSNRAVSGRKRCEDHKGMRINAFLFLLNSQDLNKTMKDEKSDTVTHEETLSRFCEAITMSGSPCTRNSSKGSKRCWQHSEKNSDEQSPEIVRVKEVVICGVKLCNGLICERSPVKERKRCQEHKGMRIVL